jgi:hypothetical protein
MASAKLASMAEAGKIYETLKTDLFGAKPDLAKCGDLLTRAKIALAQGGALLLVDSSTSQKDLILARTYYLQLLI